MNSKLLEILLLLLVLLSLISCEDPFVPASNNSFVSPLSFSLGDYFNYDIYIDDQLVDLEGSRMQLEYLGSKYYQVNDSTTLLLERIKMPVLTDDSFQNDTSIVKLWYLADNVLIEYGYEKVDSDFLVGSVYETKIHMDPLILIDYDYPTNYHLGNTNPYHNIYTIETELVYNNENVKAISLIHKFYQDQYWNNYDWGELKIYFTSFAIVKIEGKIDNHKILLLLR